MPPRSNSPPPTKRPPPDPIDAARESLDRAVAAGKAFRDADWEDPTGRFDVQRGPVVQVHNHFDSVHDGDEDDDGRGHRHSALPKIPKSNKGVLGAVLTGAGALIAGAAAVAHALGWL